MKEQLKSLLGDSAIYGLAAIVNRFLGLLLIPLYTSVLPPEEYGHVGLLQTTFYLMNVFIVFSLDNASARWHYDSEDLEERQKTTSSWFFFQGLSATIAFLGFLIFHKQIGALLLGAAADSRAVIYMGGNYVVGILPLIATNWFRVQRNAPKTILFTISNAVLNLVLGYYCVIQQKMGVSGVFLAMLVSNLILNILAWRILQNLISWRAFSLSRLRDMLTFSLPFIPTTLSFWVMSSAGIYFLKIYRTPAEVGLYQLSVQISAVANLFVAAFQQAWSAFAFSVHKRSNARSIYATVFSFYSVIMIGVAAGAFLFLPAVLPFFAPESYAKAATAGGILCFYVASTGMTNIASIGLGISRHNGPIAYASLLAALLTLGLYVLITPHFAGEGVAVATLVGYLPLPALIFYSAQKIYRVEYPFAALLVALLVCTTVLILTEYYKPWVGSGFRLFSFNLCAILLISGASMLLFKRNLKLVENTANNP